MLSSTHFYTYLYLREDGTPYYVGKGKDNRAFHPHFTNRIPVPKDKARILIQEFPTETDAFEAERFLIAYYGRKDLGTGCLRNRTDGGEGSAGAIRTEEFRRKVSKARKGITFSAEIRQNMSKAQLGNGKYRLGIPHSEERRKKLSETKYGLLNPQVKLSDHQVKEIRALYATGEVTQHLLARQFNVNPSNISLIVNGKAWAHVQ